MPNWSEVLQQIRSFQVKHAEVSKGAVDHIRRAYLQALNSHTKRHVIAYYSGWLSKPGIAECEITDEDKNGFMMAVHGLRDRKAIGLDLILHTPGGSIAATESIVDYLHKMFGHDIRVIVPQIAMSAGTMIACSSKQILMARHSNLGPIDPHLNGLPAYGVIQEFKRAIKETTKDPSRAYVWQPVIGQYPPTFLSQCENAVSWAGAFVREKLQAVMFKEDPDAALKAKRIVKKLSDFKGNKTHSRHIPFEECKAMGLNVDLIEDDQDLQDAVLTVHHCFMHSLMNTPSYKMIENHEGAAFVKQQRVIVQQGS